MSTYELEDSLVRRMLESPDLLPPSIADALRAQLPVPLPTKIGAVVRIGETHYVRNRKDHEAYYEWWHVERDVWMGTKYLPKIDEVLFEGVDL